tara:strand:+ start:371 stop:1306 length:936 start_codon:yes stop_codon:yes gene_type:complete
VIKFLISFLLIFVLFSCNEFKSEKISQNLNTSIKDIEKVVNLKKNTNNIKEKTKINDEKNTIFYYIGDSYFIEGVEYLPIENYNYTEIGLSTFYGKELHKVKTINNDFNNVTELLGRHKTLPLPSMVKITNLDNGLSINIKIVDRHYDNGSLIQVSRKVAQLLGFYGDKIATVRVDILSDASKQWKNVALSLNEPEFNQTVSSAPTETVSISEIDNSINNTGKEFSEILNPIEISSEKVQNFKLFLRIFNFENYDDIKNIMNNLDNNLKYTSEKNGLKYDLILGPLEKSDVNNLVSYFISKGYKETKIELN